MRRFVITALVLSSLTAATASAQDDRAHAQVVGLLGAALDVGPLGPMADPTIAVAARVFAPNGLGGMVRVGYQGMLVDSSVFGLDTGFAYQHDFAPRESSGVRMGVAAGVSLAYRTQPQPWCLSYDCGVQTYADDAAIGAFVGSNVDYHWGGFVLGLDLTGRWLPSVANLDLGGTDRGVATFDFAASLRIGADWSL